METNSSHGTFGLDAGERRQLLSSYRSTSFNLHKTVSKLAIKIAIEELKFFEDGGLSILLPKDMESEVYLDL